MEWRGDLPHGRGGKKFFCRSRTAGIWRWPKLSSRTEQLSACCVFHCGFDAGFAPLVRGPAAFHSYFQIISGQSFGPGVAAASQGEGAHDASSVKFAECSNLLLAERSQRTGAVASDRGRNWCAKIRGFRAGSRGKRKHVQISERQARDEIIGGGKIFVGLAREAGDYVRADGGVWQGGTNQLNTFGVVCRAIPAVHSAEDAV